jgi:type IV pilus assembly protein PilB
MKTARKRLGEVLIEAELITNDQLEAALELQKQKKLPLGELMISLGYITEAQLYKTLEYLLRIPYVELVATTIDPEAVQMVPEQLALKYMVIPIKKEGNELTVVMRDPLNYQSVDELHALTGMDIKECIAPEAEIKNAIDRYYGSEGAQKAVEELNKEYTLSELSGLAELSDGEVSNAPVVRLVNSIISNAIKSRASDIHIEPSEDVMHVRFRIDGELQEAMHSSMATHSAVITRIKIIGGMDIAEKRLPQDGRVEFKVDDLSVDLRLSILPTVYGEKVVIRILGQQGVVLTKAGLGFTEDNLQLIDKIIKSPNGIILVSGPTGSGKTTTLYTVLMELNKPTVNVITVEDPVEYKLKGINQVQVNTKAGLTFASGLRSILRQDPDIIMIGEIRDSETAQIAVRASITGHLVLSTIHTNDSASSVARLVDMGIEPYLVASSLIGVVSQRLVRKICPRCKSAYRPDHAEMMLLKMNEPRELYRGTGCPACNFTGYFIRTSVHEVLVVNRDIRDLIERRASTDALRNAATRGGTKTLRESCTKLVLEGITTTSELSRITYNIED